MGNNPVSANAGPDGAAIVCCMRNEGMFVLEWLAHHRAMGFDRIMVFTNHCTDGSDRLLARLDTLGYVTHIDHEPPPGSSPQNEATRIAMADPRILGSEWLLHIDADEFVHIDLGDGHVRDLTDTLGAQADVIILLWKLFGNAGCASWDGGSVLRGFTRAQAAPMRRTVHHKSMFRPQKFARCANHMPKEPLVEDIRVVNTLGRPVNASSIFHHRKSRYKAKFHQQTHGNACLNHYAVKSDDLFLMKNDRGDGHGAQHAKYFLNSALHRRYNRNETEDTAILRFWPRIAPLIGEMRADPEVRELEAECVARYRERRDAVLTPEQIARWTAADGAEAEGAPIGA